MISVVFSECDLYGSLNTSTFLFKKKKYGRFAAHPTWTGPHHPFPSSALPMHLITLTSCNSSLNSKHFVALRRLWFISQNVVPRRNRHTCVCVFLHMFKIIFRYGGGGSATFFLNYKIIMINYIFWKYKCLVLTLG